MNRLKIFFILALVASLLLFSSCSPPIPPVSPTADVNFIVTQTMAALTAQAIAPSTTPSPPDAINTAVAETVSAALTQTAAAVPTATLEETAPDPLPATHTGIILNNGECFNFDNGQVTAPDSQCDVWLVEPALFRQMNGAQISGYVTMEAPTRNHCASATYETGDLAVQTDLYMCFISNEGQVGFIVVREYRGNVPFTGIVFDYWVFR